jgi:hypothetical protein
MGKIIAIISFVIFLAAFAFSAVGYGAPWWWVDDIFGLSSFGLFQACVKTGTENDSWECTMYDTQFWCKYTQMYGSVLGPHNSEFYNVNNL